MCFFISYFFSVAVSRGGIGKYPDVLFWLKIRELHILYTTLNRWASAVPDQKCRVSMLNKLPGIWTSGEGGYAASRRCYRLSQQKP